MLGGTETGISVTYQDGTADIDFVVNVDTGQIADDSITLAKMAHGTDGNLITYDASGAPAYVVTGNDGQVLTSTGANSAPVFETLPSNTATATLATTVTVTNDATTNARPVVFHDGSDGLLDDTGTFQYTPNSGDLGLLEVQQITTTHNVIVGGNLTVNGTTTTVNSTTVEIADQFIVLAKDANSTAVDAGIIVEDAGTAFGWDESANRWGVDHAGAASGDTSLAPDSFVSCVVATDLANYRYNGNIRITSDEIYIYVE